MESAGRGRSAAGSTQRCLYLARGTRTAGQQPAPRPSAFDVRGATVHLTGARLEGLTEGTGGNCPTSPTNHPIVLLAGAEGQGFTVAPTRNWSASATDAQIPGDAPVGWLWTRAVANGLIAPAQGLLVSGSLGDSCQSDLQCGSGACVDGACCDRACASGQCSLGLCGAVRPGPPPGPLRLSVGCSCAAAPSGPLPALLAGGLLWLMNRRRRGSCSTGSGDLIGSGPAGNSGGRRTGCLRGGEPPPDRVHLPGNHR
jgi:hypothetical protein